MLPSDFKYSDNFTALTPAQIQAAIDAVETVYYGALLCWADLPEPVRTNKRNLLENLLVGWYLANFYPSNTRGIVANGGMPVSSKTIGGTAITFTALTVQEGLESLNTNTFGVQALAMIQSAPERFTIYG